MTTNQLYSLTWGDFGTSLVSAVQLLRCHGDLVDVTLAAGGRCFPAHKIVLCAASPFLLELLKSTPCKHPVVMLAGVTATDLEALLEFVYRGEVSVDPNQLPSLLQAAHCLNIQGLAPQPANDSHQTALQHALKVIDMDKTDIINQSQVAPEGLTRDDLSTFAPLRRRKRIKRKNSNSSRITPKWARQDCVENTENRPIEQESVAVNEHGEVVGLPDVQRKTSQNSTASEASTEVWIGSDLNFSNVSTSSRIITSQDPLLMNQSHIVAHNINQGSTPTTSNTTTTTTTTIMPKVKSASDQPGACPLCGAMLRQARNLRRHLVTSCKYRDTSEAALQATTASSTSLQADIKPILHSREPDLHQLQPVAMQTVERVAPSSAAHLENKTSVLTHISCNNMIVTDCNNMNSALK